MIRRYTDRFLNNRSGRADTRHAISTAVLLAIVTLTAPPCLADVNFTEDFSTSTLKDAANTTAHWSTAQQQVYLDWRDAQADAFTGTTPGADVLTGDSTASQRLAIGDVNGDGLLDIVVTKGSTEYNQLYINDGSTPTPGFTKHDIGTLPADLGNYAASVALGDVDDDGDLDVVEGHSTGNRVYINDGALTPTFTGSDISTGETASRALVLLDVDGDGDLDLVAGKVSATNKVYIGNGDGTFGAGTDITTDDTADTNNALAVGDVDGDGNLDIVAGNDATGANANPANILYLGDGSGGFTRSVIGDSDGAGAGPTRGIALGDVNGDGFVDVVASNFDNVAANHLYLNNGTGAPFNGVTASDIGTNKLYSRDITLADVDGDGDLDVITAEGGANRLYLNDGTSSDPFGSVTTGTVIASGDTDTSFGVATGDLSGDGKLDLAFANATTDRFYLNTGTPAVVAASPIFEMTEMRASVGTDCNSGCARAVAIADLDNDGDLDVVIGNHGLLGVNGHVNHIYWNNGTDTPFNGVTGVDLGTEADVTTSIVLADVDGNANGLPDVVVGNNGVNRVYPNLGGQSFGAAINITGDSDNTRAIAVADVDGDGDLDVAAGNSGAISRIYLNDGSANFTGSDIGTSTFTVNSIALGNLNSTSDSYPDVVLGTDTGVDNQVVINNFGTSPTTPFAVASAAVGSETNITNAVALGDVNGDTYLDLVAGNTGVNRFYAGNGDGTFQAGSDVDSGNTDTTYSVALVSNVDDDGDLDLVVGNATDNYFYESDAGAFGTGVTFGTSPYSATTYALAVADVDGNGLYDVVTANGWQPLRYQQQLPRYRTDAGAVRSLTVDNTATFTNATLDVTSSEPAGTGIDWYLSSNGGTSWFQVTPNTGTAFVFPVSSRGSDLRWRAKLASQSPVLSPVVTGVTVTSDTTPPSATLGYSGSGPDAGIYRLGDTVTITANFGEDVASSPAMRISVSAPTGGNPVGPVDMSRVSATQYTYLYTVGNGSGTVNVSLSNGTDLLGNPVDAVPFNGSFTISKTDQTINSFTAPSSGTVGGTTGTLSATASSNLAVTFGSATTGICTVSGNTVSYKAAGTCTVTADQAGNANYNAAPQVTKNITVSSASSGGGGGALGWLSVLLGLMLVRRRLG